MQVPGVYQVTLYKKGDDDKWGDRKSLHVVGASLVAAVEKAETRFPEWQIDGVYRVTEELLT